MTRSVARAETRPRRPSRFEYATVRVTFESEGSRCVGTLYRPDRPATPPVVVMANGLGADREFGLPQFAERFAEAGYAAFLFDYRHFGDSEGEPRNLVSVRRQLADWRAAMDAVESRDGVDGRRIALWGTSFSGGHVVRLAAESTRVRAVVAQNPMLDGRGAARALPLSLLATGVLAGLRDRFQSRFLGPYTLPVVGSPGELAFITAPGAKAGFLALVPEDSDWENEMPARAALSVPRYRPVTTAEDVTCPTLLVSGTRDDIVPPETVEKAADAMPDATLVRLPIGHFDAYRGAFEEVVAHELAFLDARLGR